MRPQVAILINHSIIIQLFELKCIFLVLFLIVSEWLDFIIEPFYLVIKLLVLYFKILLCIYRLHHLINVSHSLCSSSHKKMWFPFVHYKNLLLMLDQVLDMRAEPLNFDTISGITWIIKDFFITISFSLFFIVSLIYFWKSLYANVFTISKHKVV